MLPTDGNLATSLSTGISENAAAIQLAALITPETDHETPDESLESEGEQPELEQTDTEVEPDPATTADVQSDEEDEPAAPAPEPRKLRVKTGDVEEELPEDEVVKGYLRTKDYTQKTQALAEARRQQEAEFAQVKAERQKYANDFAQIETILKASNGAEPDWNTLRATDPILYAQTWADWGLKTQQLAQVTAEKQRAQQQVQADNVAAHNARIAAEAARLPELIPSWKDEAVMQAEKQAIAKYVVGQGIPLADLQKVTDANVIAMLNKARLYDEAQAKRPAIQKQISAVRTAAPGAATPTQPRGAVQAQKAIDRAVKTGRQEDVAAAMARLLNG